MLAYRQIYEYMTLFRFLPTMCRHWADHATPPIRKNEKVTAPVKKTELTAGGTIALTTRHPLSAKVGIYCHIQ
jgi:hypothetical protein